MSLVKDIIQSLVEKGKLVHEVELLGIKFEMEVLTTEEQMLADGMVDIGKLNAKYKAELQTYRDSIEKFRSLSQLSFAVKKMNGQFTVDPKLTFEDQHKQRIEFRDELASLGVTVIDKLLEEYRVGLIPKHQKFFEQREEIVGK